MLAGVSTRRFARTREPVGRAVVDAERSTSKSRPAASSSARTGEHLAGADGPLAGRRSPRRADARRPGAEGPLLRRRARRHYRSASRSRSGCGTARRRTSASASSCSPTSSTAAWTATRASWSSWTAARRCGPPSTRSSATSRSSVCVRQKERNVLRSLETEPRQPAKRRTLESLGLGVTDGKADGERVGELDLRQLGRGVADEG